jgi:hypothetical protein
MLSFNSENFDRYSGPQYAKTKTDREGGSPVHGRALYKGREHVHAGDPESLYFPFRA